MSKQPIYSSRLVGNLVYIQRYDVAKINQDKKFDQNQPKKDIYFLSLDKIVTISVINILPGDWHICYSWGLPLGAPYFVACLPRPSLSGDRYVCFRWGCPTGRFLLCGLLKEYWFRLVVPETVVSANKQIILL